MHDPLTINLQKQNRVLLEQISSSPHVSLLRNATTRPELLNTLSKLLALPSLTLLVATVFRPLLLDLCSRWLLLDGDQEDRLEAFGLLLEVHPETYPVLSAFLRQPGLAEGPLTFVTSLETVPSIDTYVLHRILLAYYRILQANRELPGLLTWSLAPLSHLMWAPHPDTGIRFLAIRCYALQSGMGEAERVKLERQVLGEVEDTPCPIHYGRNIDDTPAFLDGWILPIVEADRVARTRQALLKPQNYYMSEDNCSVEPIHPAELSPYIANIHGILMFCASGVPPPRTALIATPSSIDALRQLATHLSIGVPTLLTSPPSSGKSLLLTHLAFIMHPETQSQIITIHLADTSLDPRSLLGSYISSTTRPGTFEWKEGVLVRAMREGKWVVLEDIDRGSNEVLGLIKPLVESIGLDRWVGGRAAMEVPSRGRVVAHESFALFATRSVLPSRNGNFPSPAFFGAHKFYETTIPSPTHHDLRIIMDARFPRIAGATNEGLIRLWEAVSTLGTVSSVRDVGLRELEKICRRVDNLLPSDSQSMEIDIPEDMSSILSTVFPNVSIREDILFEIRDVLFGAGVTTASARSHLNLVAATVAEHLGLTPERRGWVLNAKIPEFQLEKDINGSITSVRFGRTRLSSNPVAAGFDLPPSRTFAMHKPATLLMSRISTAVSLNEPVLLTGETGTGKTSVVSHLASLLRKPLISLNLSHQTESSDIVGGFKPIDARVPAAELHGRFLDLFGGTFSRKRNEEFEGAVGKAVQESKWKRAVALWIEATRRAKERIAKDSGEKKEHKVEETDGPRKRRKTERDITLTSWGDFERDVQTFEIQHVQGNGKFAFGFVEGPLVKALRSGHWILLDEINLASAETLECISSLLHGPTASITLTEQGSLEPVARHPDFRLFACMNPATDVGKKDLPPNIRSRFTEIDVPPPDADKETLLSIVTHYIGPYAVGDKAAIMDVAEFYAAIRKLAEGREIADGSNHRPHFSMRTLTRALTFTADLASTHSLRRALWEGTLMAFTMILDDPSTAIVTSLAQKHILAGVRNPRSLLAKDPSPPHGHSLDEFMKFGPFYLQKGPLPPDPMDEYIMTPSVETKLIDLARIIVTRRFPVLIEGPTSSGKTSSIEYLARRTGHRFVRINNHEHTDIQEYLGTYVSDPATGKLVFKDGLLVRALRNGDWIVLDELNLAPTDVLEALNRLLDDNRELVIPETQEVVRPHPHFLLFATQNPPGLYGGRKVLSRAFRNRFLEVHFNDVPQAELEHILCQRCKIAPSYAQRIVGVFQELQRRRQSSRIFESKHGFATLRDLFRWAGRDAIGYQELAENGYMLLAERARRPDDTAVAKEVIESVMKVKIDASRLYDLHGQFKDALSYLGCQIPESSQLVWTSGMRRLFVLLARALKFHEPVLLVGETGCGKTSVCQLYAQVLLRKLHAVNCHQNTETADLIGGLRPLRNRTATEAAIIAEAQPVLKECGFSECIVDLKALGPAIDASLKTSLDHTLRASLQDIRSRLRRLSTMFQWYDGPLVEAMRNGEIFLLDEISLADDSVLERLNSVLEPNRTIVLAERGDDDLDLPTVEADDRFEIVATMNPGGDYGKKELSPALRNRFTEIWVPPVDDRRDLELIVHSLWKHEELQLCTDPLLDFADWLSQRISDKSIVGLRDILAWVNFSNAAYGRTLSVPNVFHHAANMTFLDGLGSLPQLSTYATSAISKLKKDALAKLQELFPIPEDPSEAPHYDPATHVQFGMFAISKGLSDPRPNQFSFQAPTTRDNINRVVRACQLAKPVLLEGSPGVGKTSLVAALANICGYDLCRINLSDQTDLIDLFGSDLPVEGGGPGQFAWREAEFLRAMQEGHWVLLDEMNLAPQAILEGLNAVLDHRGTVYIPELGRTFTRHPSFRIFAAQNPFHQGGGRKGLPKSFLNRFTKVYVQELTSQDVLMVCRGLFPDIPEAYLTCMISYTARLQDEVMTKRTFGREGSPWEFNLRDVIRWASLAKQSGEDPGRFLDVVFLQRFRNQADRNQAKQLFKTLFPDLPSHHDGPRFTITPSFAQFGLSCNPRNPYASSHRSGKIIPAHLPAWESLGLCITHSWLSILTGPQGSGKTSLVRTLANLAGHPLHEIHINTATDASDILGSFEDVDPRSRVTQLAREAVSRLSQRLASAGGSKLYSSVELTPLIESLNPGSVNTHSLDTALRALKNLFPRGDEGALLDFSRDLMTLTTSTSSGRFEWVDGPLIKALRDGHWVLLDNANLCNPSVLDRLNSLCETDGQLTLNERGVVNGQVQVIKPHPSFRLFMCVDARFGELSRAMRNRGIEIALLPPNEDYNSLLHHARLPATIDTHYLDLPFAHDHLRRGIADKSLFTPPSVISPTSHLWGEDSACASMGDIIAELSNQPGEQSNFLPSLHFVAQSVPFAHLSLMTRLVQHLRPLSPLFSAVGALTSDLRKTRVYGLTHDIRQNASMFSVTPLELFHAQPMDLMMHRLSLIRGLDEDTSMINSLMLRLAVVLKSARERSSLAKRADLMRQSPQAHSQIFDVVANTIGSVYNASEELSQNAKSADEHSHNQVLLAIRLLGYTQYLYRVLSADILDYSALYAASTWLIEAFREYPQCLESVRGDIHTLDSKIALTTGLGMTRIWASLTKGSSADDDNSQAFQLDGAAVGLSPTHRSAILELIALQSLSRRLSPTESQAVEGLANRIQAQLSENREHEPPRAAQPDGPLLLFELALLGDLPLAGRLSHSEAHTTQIQQRLRLALEDPNARLAHLAPYKHLMWADDHDHGNLNTVAAIYREWLESIWVAQLTSDISGPSLLCVPTQLHSVLKLADWSTQAVSCVTSYESLLRQRSELVLLQLGQPPRTIQLIKLLSRSLLVFLSPFLISSGERGPEKSMLLPRDFEGAWKIWMLQFLASPCDSKFDYALRAFQKNLNQALQRLCDCQVDTHDIWYHLGQCWLGLCRFILDLFIPDKPIDPVTLEECAHEFKLEQVAAFTAQIAMHIQLELRTSGQRSNNAIVLLASQLPKFSDLHSRRGEAGGARRRDVSKLHSYWLEVEQFLRHVVSPQRLNPLVGPEARSSDKAALQEATIQGSLTAFCQRLGTAYPEFPDLYQPLQLALYFMKLGIRLSAHANSLAHTPSLDPSITPLTVFPSVKGAGMLQVSNEAASTSAGTFEKLLVRLAASAFEVSVGVGVQFRVKLIGTLYEQALGLWLIDRARDAEREREEQSLYKRKTLESDGLNDAELEEQDFLSLFPEFGDILDAPIAPGPGPKARISYLVDATLSFKLLEMHQYFFSAFPVDASRSIPVSFALLKRSILEKAIDSHVGHLSHFLDYETSPLQIALLYERLGSLTGSPHTKSKPYDFYTDHNMPEGRKFLSVLESFGERLKTLITEWPDQMVLQHLKDRCDAALSLSLHSPIAKFLSALEHLLTQSDDWEKFANRDNTIKAHQLAFTNLIVEWRRLELASWQDLLEIQAHRFLEGLSEWWFRLYEVNVHGLLKAVYEGNGDDKVTAYLDGLVPLLDEFMTHGPLGQFALRLRLLQSFEEYTKILSLEVAEVEAVALRRARCILHSFRRYYEQFVGKIASSLSEKRGELEKDIRGFIKLASWKDINVHALKQSAQKTHHQLYKSIKKFREVLRRPVADLLRPITTDDSSRPTQLSNTTVAISLAADFPETTLSTGRSNHLENLTLTFSKFNTFIGESIVPFIHSYIPHHIEYLANEIASTAKALSTLPIPTGADAARRAKLSKNLLQRKRKAWSDMLKELKRAGLAANVKPEVLTQQQNIRWLREQPILVDFVHPRLENKVDHYWHRLMGSLPLLRSVAGDHHSDLSTRELQRGFMFVESCFSVALIARSRLADARISLRGLHAMSQRLRQLSAHPHVQLAGPDATNLATFVADTLCRLVNALQEMSQHLQVLRELPGEVSAPIALLESIGDTVKALQSKHKLVSAVQLDVQSIDTALLLRDEHTTVTDALALLEETSQNLLGWSSQFPRLKQFILPVHRWLSTCTPPQPEARTNTSAHSIDRGDEVIEALLLSVQNLLSARPQATVETDEQAAPDAYIKEGWTLVTKLTDALALPAIQVKCSALFESIVHVPVDEISTCAKRVIPFLANFLALAEAQVEAQAQWTKSLLKLDYILCSVIHSLAKDGFCQPNETEEGGDAEGGEAMEGTGLGEGSGAQNISKEIQDESQVEGLQGESTDPDEDVERAEEDNAIEMADDFGGKMQDVPEGDAEEDGGEEKEDESEVDPEEQLGKLDANDETAVDEKLWGDEKGPEGQDENNKKSGKDDSTQQSSEQDIVAKEGQKGKDEKEKAPKGGHSPEGEVEEQQPDDRQEENEEQDEPGKEGAPLDEFVQNADTLDLPDDLDMDPGNDAQDEDAIGDDEDDAMSDVEEAEDENAGGMGQAEDDVDAGSGNEGADMVCGDLPEDENLENEAEKDVAQPDMSAGDGGADGVDTSQQPNEADTSPSLERDSTSRGQAGENSAPSQGATDVEMNQAETEAPQPQPMPANPEQAAGPSGPDSSSGRNQQSSSQPTFQQQQPQELPNNPLRSLGDALAEITRRFDDILQGEGPREEVPKQADVTPLSQLEYLRDDEQAEEMQALGPAGPEKGAKLDELKFTAEENPSAKDESAPMEMEEFSDPHLTEVEVSSLEAQPATTNKREGVESALTPSDIRKTQTPAPGTAETFEGGPPSTEISSRTDHENDNVQVERALREWQAQGQPSEQAEHMWRLYESLTHDLSYALCEQLRLILEPTQATRLKGDYRTGKRLNMKKIIPYIASEYTKDKIWLRRTRPSQREYQVLVALDDSRSMAESHSVHLAYQTLALVSKALSRLEVGDIAIAKFGEAVEILHGFDKGPFTDQAGSAILDAFKFDQKATQVLSLVETSLSLLERVREQRSSRSSSASDLWQMEIIISDGICQDHERLATVLRKAEEQRVMVVFIILDSLHSKQVGHVGSSAAPIPAVQSSILEMNQVAYKVVGGRTELSVTKYLDTFPFEYYVVVRDVEALPDVLAGTLKQFFERISEN